MSASTMPEALPDLSGVYQLAEDQIEWFQTRGHLKLERVFTRNEVEAFRGPLEQVVESHSAEAHAMEQKVAGSAKNWRFVNNLWTLDPTARLFILNRRLGRLAADLMGVEGVRLFRDQSYFKGPLGANTPWHQDAYFMPLETDKILTLWVPLTDISPDLAPMSYVTGSNRAGYMGTSNGDDESMDRFEDEARAKGFQVANYGAFAAGDVAAHSGWTLHSSRTNMSAAMREVIVIVYFEDGATAAPEQPLGAGARPQEFYAKVIRQQNRATSLPGIGPGELAASLMTPLVYHRSWESAAL